MRFLIDEAVSPRVADALIASGHDAVHVRELGLASAEDRQILERARAEQRVVVTQDQDFGTLLAVSREAAPSVVRLRLRDARAAAHAKAILTNLTRIQDDLRHGAIVVIADATLRIRRLPVL